MVDDNAANLLALESVLKGEGYHLLSAPSGQKALDLLKDNEVDVILLDIQMPDLDGYEVARRIKEIPHCRNIPIIFITAIFTEDPHIRKGYEAGAVDYFTKPFDPEILKLKIAIYASFRQRDILLKEKEKRIKESEELLKAGHKLSAILETMPVGVIIANVEGRIVQTNDVVLKIWKSVEPIENDSYGDFINWWSHSGQIFKEMFVQVIDSGASTHNKIIEIKCFDETSRTVLSSISPLRGLDDHIVGAVAVIQDITEHKRIEKDLEQRIMKLISLGVEFEQMAPH
jgi:PAS domain S-box-containing protein